MKKRREAWVALNAEAAAPLVAELNAGKINEAEFWRRVEKLGEVATRRRRIDFWLSKHQDLNADARPLLAQLETGEISEDDFWWLLGERPAGWSDQY